MPYTMLVLSTVRWDIMETARKIIVEVPLELLEKAQRASGTGITQTVRTGLRLLAASQTYGKRQGGYIWRMLVGRGRLAA